MTLKTSRRDDSSRIARLWWPVVLFLLALAPRLPGLRLFLTSDERTNIYWAGSQFVEGLLTGDLSLTYWHFYPGVTMSWLETLGFAGKWLLDRLGGAADVTLASLIQQPILDLVVAMRLPYALLTAAGVAATYVLARRLMGRWPALVGALLLAFDPFFLAHSRVAHGDAPVAVFMMLSVLALLCFLKTLPGREPGAWWWLVLSAVMGALAALTKAPGQLIALFVFLVGVGDWAIHSVRQGRLDWRYGRRWLAYLVVWGGVSAFLFYALWPAMWTQPVGTLTRMIEETFGKVEEGHLVFFMGQPTLDPGPWFYPYVTAFRLTPVTLAGALLSGLLLIGAWLWPKFARKNTGPYFCQRLDRVRDRYRAAALIWLFIAGLLLFGILSAKKQDRYLMPVFPCLDVLAGFALVEAGAGIKALVSRIENERVGTASGAVQTGLVVILAGLLAWHAWPVAADYPYYLAYFNPVMGGLPRAIQTTLVGWGEGMEQAAAYLNQRPDANDVFVASVPSQTLLPYFRGSGENFYSNDVALRADVVVLYVSQVQRLAPSPEIVRYFLSRQPEHVVTVLGQPYARIYQGPRLILEDVPASANLANVGFGDEMRLAGYETSIQGDRAEIVLYWHCLAPIDRDFSFSVRLLAEDGTWLAQQDAWPADGLLPTHQWRQGDYVTDRHTLEIPGAPVVDRVQVVVYDAGTGEALASPLDLPLTP